MTKLKPSCFVEYFSVSTPASSQTTLCPILINHTKIWPNDAYYSDTPATAQLYANRLSSQPSPLSSHHTIHTTIIRSTSPSWWSNEWKYFPHMGLLEVLFVVENGAAQLVFTGLCGEGYYCCHRWLSTCPSNQCFHSCPHSYYSSYAWEDLDLPTPYPQHWADTLSLFFSLFWAGWDHRRHSDHPESDPDGCIKVKNFKIMIISLSLPHTHPH